MADTMTLDFTVEGRTAEQWREQARQSNQRAADSFASCDTDGFLSQWASGIMAREYMLKADLAEAGGMWSFSVLTDLDGVMVPAKRIETRYGTKWAVFESFEDMAAYGATILAWIGTGERAMKNKGYALGWVKARGYATTHGGNGGYTSVGVMVKPCEAITPENSTPDPTEGCR